MSRSAMDLHRLLYPTAKKPSFYHSFCLSTNNIAEETRFLTRLILHQWHFVKISKDHFQLIFTDLGN